MSSSCESVRQGPALRTCATDTLDQQREGIAGNVSERRAKREREPTNTVEQITYAGQRLWESASRFGDSITNMAVSDLAVQTDHRDLTVSKIAPMTLSSMQSVDQIVPSDLLHDQSPNARF